VKKLGAPFDLVFDSLPRGLVSAPQLKVLNAVVISDAILVVDILARKQIPTEVQSHHQAMHKDLPPSKFDHPITLFVGMPRWHPVCIHKLGNARIGFELSLMCGAIPGLA
jgi:hypothetical protein